MSLLGNFGKYEGAPTSGDTLLGKLGNAAWKLNSDPNWQMLQARQRGEDPYAGQLMQMRQQQMQQQNTLMQQRAEEQRLQRQKIEAFMQSPEFQQLDPLSKQLFAASGDFGVLKGQIPGGKSDAPSNVREWEYYNRLSEEQKNQYLEMKRAAQVMDLGNRFGVRNPVTNTADPIPGGDKTVPPQDTVNHRRNVAEAEASARANVDLDKADTERSASNSTALSVYEEAMSVLVSGLEGSDTGPIVGRLPAFTARQQIAEGAVSAMAPILKSVFREAGEGTFTDKDQEMLLNMLPTRKDHEEARDEKLRNVDAIIRMKLGGGPVRNDSAELSGRRLKYNPATGEFE